MVAGLACGAVAAMPVLAAGDQEKPDRGWIKGARKPAAAGTGIAGLPDAHGRSFRTLDEYLAHLRAVAAPVDRPWYREVRPGVFRLETGNLRAAGVEPRTFTREQLERRFGFRR